MTKQGAVEMDKQRLKQLLTAYAAESITRDELDELLAFVADRQGDADLNTVLADLMEELRSGRGYPLNSDELYGRIISHPDFFGETRRTRRRIAWWGAAVAAVVLGFFLIGRNPQASLEPSEQVSVEVFRTTTDAPAERLTLRLADGREIDLDSAANGLLALEGNTEIRLEGEELRYEGETASTTGEIVRNTIITPKGRQYQIVLPDGSRVWLNAATTLVYPVRFHREVREVEISGEAYFEVQHASDWPFIVRTSSQQVEVLGTSFNVCAYDDDRRAKTTLVTGQVKVSSAAPGGGISPVNATVLRPGQQAVTTPGSSGIRIEAVDTDEVIAWKDNLFVFQNEEISEVMKKISRWYDVEVEYRDGMAGKRIGGSIPRFENISELMDALQATKLLNYQMKGGTIIIMK